MHWLFLLAIALAMCGLVLLLFLQKQAEQDVRQRFEEVLKTHDGMGWLSAKRGPTSQQDSKVLSRVFAGSGQSQEMLFRRAGLTSPTVKTFYYSAAAAAPFAGALLMGLWAVLNTKGVGDTLAIVFFGFGAGYLLPSRILAWIAARRKKIMRGEMLAVLHLMRMLFDAGLSLEHALRVISEQGRELVPELAIEISGALSRINAGQERGDALEEMAAPLDVPELNDTVAILKQATQYGGSLRESLARFATLMEQRHMTDLREYVGKLSAKMTVVMIAFMFPALMIFLAGPGFLALGRALMKM